MSDKHSMSNLVINISSDVVNDSGTKNLRQLGKVEENADAVADRDRDTDSENSEDSEDNYDYYKFRYENILKAGGADSSAADINEDEVCCFDDLIIGDAELVTEEYLTANVPHIPMTTTLIVAATKINHEVAEMDISTILLANEHIPIIECNYAISICVECRHPVIAKVAELLLNPEKLKPTKKQSTSKMQIVTTTDKNGRILSSENRVKHSIKQYMNSCIQYNVIGINNIVYRVKRFTTGNIQVPNTIDENSFEDAKYAVDKIIEYESKLFGRPISYSPDYLENHDGKYFHINLLNYKFEVIKDWIINITKVNKYIKELKNQRLAATGGIIPVNLPHIEDVPLNYDNLYISDINDDMKNAVLYVAFNIPTVKLLKKNSKPNKGKPKKIARKNITVSISPNGKCNIQGGMENRQPAQLIYEFLLDMFKTRPEFYIKQLLTDDQIRARAIERVDYNSTIYQMYKQRLQIDVPVIEGDQKYSIIARDIYLGNEDYEIVDDDDYE